MKFWHLCLRNLKENYRDPMALGFLLGFPLLFMMLFGVAFGGDTTPSYTVGVIDDDNSSVSQVFVNEVLTEVPTIEALTFDSSETALKDLKLGDISAYIVLPEGFGQQVSQIWQGEEGDIALNITYDESDLMVSEQIISTVNYATRSFAQIEIPITINANPIHIETEITNIDFIAPGIIIFGILIMIPTSARVMVRDKEKGLLSRLLTTPTRPWEFISSYSICLVVLAIAQIIVFILLGWWFGMDIVGSPWLAFIIFLLTALCSIGIGMVVASVTRTENQAEPLCWLFSMPLAAISGAWFSIEFMPSYLRGLAYAFPFAHAIDASRAVLIRGSGLEAVSGDLLFLVGWAVGIFILGIILFGRTMRS
jgi:ABC-2 type transport system permease protein